VSPVEITTNINPEQDRDNAQERRYVPDLYPYASSALSSGLVEVANQQPIFAFSAHQTPTVSRRGSLSSFIENEMNRPDALSFDRAFHEHRTAVPVPDARPFLPHLIPPIIPFRQDASTGANPVGRPSNESVWNQRIIIPRPYQQVAEQKEPDTLVLTESDLARYKKGGKINVQFLLQPCIEPLIQKEYDHDPHDISIVFENMSNIVIDEF
jgi:hypothetical protein